MKPRITTVDISSSEDEAVEATIHHLRLSLMFFMNTPNNHRALLLEEAERIIKLHEIIESEATCIRACIEAMDNYDKDLKAND